jgi:polyphosphate kinase 2 (PPK2 family)
MGRQWADVVMAKDCKVRQTTAAQAPKACVRLARRRMAGAAVAHHLRCRMDPQANNDER